MRQLSKPDCNRTRQSMALPRAPPELSAHDGIACASGRDEEWTPLYVRIGPRAPCPSRLLAVAGRLDSRNYGRDSALSPKSRNSSASSGTMVPKCATDIRIIMQPIRCSPVPTLRDQGPYAGLAEPLADGSAGEAGSRLSVRLSAFLRRRPSADAGGPPRCARTSGPESWRLRPWGAFSRVQRRSLSSSPRSALYPGFPTSYRKSGGPAAASAETLLHPLRLTHRDVPPRESDAPAHDWRVCGSGRPRRREAVPARCKVPNPRHAAACQAVVCGAVGCHERLTLPLAAEISCVPLFGQRYLIDMVGPGR